MEPKHGSVGLLRVRECSGGECLVGNQWVQCIVLIASPAHNSHGTALSERWRRAARDAVPVRRHYRRGRVSASRHALCQNLANQEQRRNALARRLPTQIRQRLQLQPKHWHGHLLDLVHLVAHLFVRLVIHIHHHTAAMRREQSLYSLRQRRRLNAGEHTGARARVPRGLRAEYKSEGASPMWHLSVSVSNVHELGPAVRRSHLASAKCGGGWRARNNAAVK